MNNSEDTTLNQVNEMMPVLIQFMQANRQIEPEAWASIFMLMIAQMMKEGGHSYEQYTDALNMIASSFKTYFEKEEISSK